MAEKLNPGFMVMKKQISDPPTPKISQTERMGVGGTKATMRHKGRVDPKAANPMDPGPTPAPPSEVINPTNDKNAMKGYVVGKAWPNKKTAEFEPSDSVTAPHE